MRINKNNIYFLPILVVGLVLTILVTGLKDYDLLTPEAITYQDQLAQITAIETKLLKQWQQSGALKIDLHYQDQRPEVAMLQKMLGQDKAIYPEGKVTGYYGTDTHAAVKRFQQEQNLDVTGEVNQATREQLNKIFLAHLCPESDNEQPDLSLENITANNRIPRKYIPAGLEEISKKVRSAGIVCLKKDIVPSLTEMFKAAEHDGVKLMITSGFRSVEIQQYLYDFWTDVGGPTAHQMIARPGLSEHQLGTAIDLTDESIGFNLVDPRFANSKGGRWLEKNAAKYGFALSYPQGRESETGFLYEPWHWRYRNSNI